MADDKNMVEEPIMITLEFDDDSEVECEVAGTFECNGRDYIALFPQDGSDDVYLYGFKQVGEDEFELLDIEDDDEFRAVSDTYDSIMSEEE